MAWKQNTPFHRPFRMSALPPPDPGQLSILIPRTRDGDAGARDELLSLLQAYLAKVAQNQVDPGLRQKTAVSDIVQLSFVRIIENFEQFRGNNSRELRAWIKQIVINESNLARRQFRTAKRDIGREDTLDSPSGGDQGKAVDLAATPSSEAVRKERIQRFHEILGRLSDDHATVIRLRNIEQLTFREIGETMQRSEEAASQLWYRAIERFEELLVNSDESPNDG